MRLQPWLSGIVIAAGIAAAWKLEPPGWQAPPLRRPPAQAPGAAANGTASPGRAAGPYRKPWAWWRAVLVRTYEEAGEDRLLAVAAGVVFYALLAIFPTVTAFVSLYGLFASTSTVGGHVALLAYVLPAGGVDIVLDQVTRIVGNGDGKLGFAFFAGLATALWSANAGVKAMMDAINVIDGRAETRSFLRLNAVSLTLTLGTIVFLLLAVGAVVAFPLVMSAFGFEAVTGATTWLARWPVLMAVAVLALSVIYRFGPSGDRSRHWRLLTPGVLFAASAWLAGSAGLSLYLSKFADYNATYGSLGAAIGLMMWMWLTTIAVLAGAELDSVIDGAAKGDTFSLRPSQRAD